MLAFYANAARFIIFSGTSHFCLVELFLVWFSAVMLRRFLMIAWIVVFSSCAQGFSESSGQQNQAMGLIMMTALFPKIPRFAYSTNFNSNNIWMYAVDYSSGMLGSLGTIPAGTGPSSIKVDSAGKFAYASNNGSGNVTVYSINQSTGLLTSLGNTPTNTGSMAVCIHPSGKFLYVGNATANTISVFSIDQTTGLLTPLTPSPATNPTGITIDATGTYLYASNTGGTAVLMFSINPLTGLLTANGSMQATHKKWQQIRTAVLYTHRGISRARFRCSRSIPLPGC